MAVSAPDDIPLMRRGSPFWLEWAMNPLWEDGRAEVAEYDAEQELEGESRRFTLTQITGKQEFSQQFNVQTSQRGIRDAFPVLQLTQLYSVPGQPYPQHVQVCQVFRRDQPVQLHKLTATVQEWGGSVFKTLTDDGLQYQQQYNSYQEGEGAGQRLLHRGVLVEDALPYTLRSLSFEKKPAFAARIYELQQTSHASAPSLYKARIQVEEAAAADTPEPAWRVRVRLSATRENVYWFARSYPNVLLRQTTWNGRRLWLKRLSRVPMRTPADSAAAPGA
ncbi:hypothetical protein [Hymenobacter sp. 102]|uniref:hypothetical protein n=1 Tax=Hymenobacter sp. 102 TaxID=3403152 RepID=UPI003CF7BDB1